MTINTQLMGWSAIFYILAKQIEETSPVTSFIGTTFGLFILFRGIKRA